MSSDFCENFVHNSNYEIKDTYEPNESFLKFIIPRVESFMVITLVA